MADFLSNGVSALIAFQRALDVTSQNISNVGTDGYSRQRVDFVTKPAQKFGNGWVGSGVNVNTITRSYDDFLATQVRGSSSGLQRSDTFATLAARVDNMFGNTTTGLSTTLQKFVSAVQDVANSPTSTAPRQVLLSTAQATASRIQQYDSQLSSLNTEVESRMKTEVSDINTLASGIAKLNGQISDALAKSAGQPPNDLLDQRDKLLDDLSAHVNVNTSDAGGGVLNVTIGNGQSLVVGTRSNTLTTKQNDFDPSQSTVALLTSSGGIDINSEISGGTLGGLIDFRGQVLDPARNSLGRIAIGIAQVVNDSQKAGIDLNGVTGTDMYSIGGVQTLGASKNTGSGTLAATRVNNSALTESDYIVQKTATGWSVRNSATGAAVTSTGAGTSAAPLLFDGLSVVASGTSATGDRFLVRPTQAAAAGLNVLITNPAQIAAASPVKSAASTANTGDATITPAKIVNATNAQLRAPVTITFTSATTYTTDGGTTTQTYTSGGTISVNGWSTTISGTPKAGDSFTVTDNAGGTGDNSNALLMAGAFDQKILSGGTDSVNSAFGGLIGDIGVATQQAQNSRDAQKSVYNDDVAARESVSGVNLDEEAANMLRYQQAYQAAAQLIGIAQTLFNSLLAATGGR
ncbi:MAG: flagellar hook-associated protein FlgK [Gammaproteobacteria bacterium]